MDKIEKHYPQTLLKTKLQCKCSSQKNMRGGRWRCYHILHSKDGCKNLKTVRTNFRTNHVPGRPATLNSAMLRKSVESNPSMSTRRLSTELGVSRRTVVRHLKAIGKVNKGCREVPHDLTENQANRRVETFKNSLKIFGMTVSFAKWLLQIKNGSTSAILAKEFNGWILTKWLKQFWKGNGSQKRYFVHFVEFRRGNRLWTNSEWRIRRRWPIPCSVRSNVCQITAEVPFNVQQKAGTPATRQRTLRRKQLKRWKNWILLSFYHIQHIFRILVHRIIIFIEQWSIFSKGIPSVT